MDNISRLGLQDILTQLEAIKRALDSVAAENEKYRDSIPQSMRNSAKYAEASTACDNLADAIASLDDAISSIDDAAC